MQTNEQVMRGFGAATAVHALAGLLLWAGSMQAGAAGTNTLLFADPATLSVVLIAPWRRILRDGDSDERYPAVLEYSDDHGRKVQLPVTVERRGLTRRALCDFPPIRLRFDRPATAGTWFEGQRSLKMVTHCGARRRWEQYYVLEMLAYRIYNVVSERSFRVRPLLLSYRDTAGNWEEPDRFGFLIEHEREMARRNDLPTIRADRIRSGDYDARGVSEFMLFQYLIGNTDWSVLTASDKERCCHNVRAIGVVGSGELYAVPYDFDSAGLVDAHYATPHERLPIRRVSDRLYRGFCAHGESLEPVRRELMERKEEIMDLVRAESRLTARNRDRTLRYLQEAFDTFESPARFDHSIMARCRR